MIRGMNWTPRTRLFVTALAFLALLCTPVAALASGHSRATTRVVGGTQAQAGAPFSSLAYLTVLKRDGQSTACSGTVVAPAVVLTAAHCVTDADGTPVVADGVQVATGRLARADDASGQLLTVSRLLPHPGYDHVTMRNDVALVLLSSTTTAPPIALGAADDATAGTRTAIAGWGATSGQDATPSPVLMTAPTTLLGDDACNRLLGSEYDAATMLCAADEPAYAASTCRGDSGGPLLAHRPDGSDVQIGVTSWGTTTCDPRVPQAFARVSSLAGWLGAQLAAAPVPAQQTPPSGIGTAASSTGEPRGGAPAPGARSARATAATYRGTTRQRRAIVLTIAGGSVTSVRVGYRIRCQRATAAGTFAAASPHGSASGSSTSRSFSVMRVDPDARRARISGRFAGTRKLSGTIRLSWRGPGGTRCDSGALRYTARRR